MTDKDKPRYTLGKDIDLSKTVILDKNGRRLTDEIASEIACKVLDQVHNSSRVKKSPTHGA